jgi:hypothetical protein
LFFFSLRNATIVSERGEQQTCLRKEINNHVRERRTTIMSERGEQQSMIVVLLSDMIVILLSLTLLLFSSLRHDCCSFLSEMIVNNDARERRTTIVSERGEQQTCLRKENNNHVRERRTTIMSERGEQQSYLRENNNHV